MSSDRSRGSKLDLPLDRRPVIVALAGPNGAGKTIFYHAHLRPAGLRFVNADVLARELSLDPYAAARLADVLRRQLVEQRESFVFETVFSDPVGDKLTFLKEAAGTGYNVVLCFIGISGPEVSEERVAMRVSQGGHDVPAEKLVARLPHTTAASRLTRLPRTAAPAVSRVPQGYTSGLANLKTATRELPQVWIFDNDDLQAPFRHVAVFENGQRVTLNEPVPEWLAPLLM